jgi:hypothetical protein
MMVQACNFIIWEAEAEGFPAGGSLGYIVRSGLFKFLLFWWHWGLNSGLCDCKAAALPHSSPVHFGGYFGDGG